MQALSGTAQPTGCALRSALDLALLTKMDGELCCCEIASAVSGRRCSKIDAVVLHAGARCVPFLIANIWQFSQIKRTLNLNRGSTKLSTDKSADPEPVS